MLTSTTSRRCRRNLLTGRRYGRSVIVFWTEGDSEAAAGVVGMPVFGLAQAVAALRSALGERAADGGR